MEMHSRLPYQHRLYRCPSLTSQWHSLWIGRRGSFKSSRTTVKPAAAFWRRKRNGRQREGLVGDQSVHMRAETKSEQDSEAERADAAEADLSHDGKQEVQPVTISTEDGEIVVQNPVSKSPMIAELTLPEGQSLETMSQALGISLETLIAANGGSREVAADTKLRFQVPTPQSREELEKIMDLQSVQTEGASPGQPRADIHWSQTDPSATLGSTVRFWAPWALAVGVIALAAYIAKSGWRLQSASISALQDRARKRRAEIESTTASPQIITQAHISSLAAAEDTSSGTQKRGKTGQTASALHTAKPTKLRNFSASEFFGDLPKPAENDDMPAWLSHHKIWLCMHQGNEASAFKFQPRLPNESSWLIFEDKETAEAFRAWSLLHRASYKRGEISAVKVVGLAPIQAVQMAASKDCGIAFVSTDSLQVHPNLQEAEMWAELMTAAHHFTRHSFHQGQLSLQQILDRPPPQPAPTEGRASKAGGSAAGGKWPQNVQTKNQVRSSPRDIDRRIISPSSFIPGRQKGNIVKADFQDSTRPPRRNVGVKSQDSLQSDSFQNSYSALRHQAQRLAAESLLDSSMQTIVANMPKDGEEEAQMREEMSGAGLLEPTEAMAGDMNRERTSSSAPFESAAAAANHMRNTRGSAHPRGPSTSSGDGSGDGGSKKSFQRAFNRSSARREIKAPDPGRGPTTKANRAQRAEEAINRVLQEYTTSQSSQTRPPTEQPSSDRQDSNANASSSSPGIRGWSKDRKNDRQTPGPSSSGEEAKKPGIQGWARCSSRKQNSLARNQTPAPDQPAELTPTESADRKDPKPEDASTSSQGTPDSAQWTSDRFQQAKGGASGFAHFSSSMSQRFGKTSDNRHSSQDSALFEMKATAKNEMTRQGTPASPDDFSRIFDEAANSVRRTVLDVQPSSDSSTDALSAANFQQAAPSETEDMESDSLRVVEPPKKIRSDWWREVPALHFPTFKDETAEYMMAMDISDAEGFRDPHFIGFTDAGDANEYVYYRRLLGDEECYTVTSASPQQVATTGAGTEELGLTAFKLGQVPVSQWRSEKLPLEESDRLLLQLARKFGNPSSSAS